MNPWVLLGFAIATEVTATLSLRASDGFKRLGFSIVVIVGYGLSFWLLGLILRELPSGVVYAIWSGFGIAIIAVAGRFLFDDRLPIAAIGGIALILVGILTINLSGAGGR
ncbi:MAG: multidrug efflux SMR transporter [Actinomycetota bacterium]